MPHFTTAIYSISFVLVFFHGFSAQADELKGWKKISSDNIEIYTDYEDNKAIKALEELEVFGTTVVRLLKGNTKKKLPPIKVYLPKSQDLYKRSGLPQRIGGFFQNSIDGPEMLVKPQDRTIDLEILYHEYVHYLVMTTSPLRFADWYNEGIADFFSTMIIRDDFIYIGKSHEGRVSSLGNGGMLKLNDLFSDRNTKNKSHRYTSKFYSSAWLTTHFLTLSARNGYPSYYANMMKFLELQSTGMDYQQAYTQSFDIPMDELSKQVKKYARTANKEGVAFDRAKEKVAYKVESLSSIEAKVALVGIFPSKEDGSLGHQYLLDAANAGNTLGLSLLAVRYATKGNYDASQSAINKLVLNNNLSKEEHYNIANSYWIMLEALAEIDGENTPGQQASMELSISKMKFHLDQSQMLGAYLPTLIAMAKYKTYFDKPAQAKAALLALTYHSPNHFSARLNAAKLYIQLGEFELAEQNLQAAQRFVSHNSKMAAETEYLRRQLQQL